MGSRAYGTAFYYPAAVYLVQPPESAASRINDAAFHRPIDFIVSIALLRMIFLRFGWHPIRRFGFRSGSRSLFQRQNSVYFGQTNGVHDFHGDIA